jgi:hypothetical protein
MREFQIGSVVPFGSYQWRILDKQEKPRKPQRQTTVLVSKEG